MDTTESKRVATGKHSCHSHGHSHSHDSGSNLKWALLLNVIFVAVEVVGGFWTNSVAILSDALHDAGDSFSLALAWYLQRISAKRADGRFTYGYRRFSSLGALITGIVLMVGLGFIVWNAVSRLFEPQEVRAAGMLALAVVGIVLNGVAAWMLHGGHSLNEKVASWHLLEDTLGWAAVLVGSAIMAVWDVPIIDPLLALGISAFVMWNVLKNLKRVALVFLQSAPAGFDVKNFDRQIKELPGVVSAHHTHTWTLDGERHVFSTHLVLQPGVDRQGILAATRHVHRLLRDQDFEHITVEVELEGESCAANADMG